MLRKCYEYRGWRGTSTGEVLQQARERMLGHRYARALALAQARSYIYARADKLESWELASWKLASHLIKLQIPRIERRQKHVLRSR